MPVPSRTSIYPIYSPARGLVKNVQGPFLDPRATPDCQNVRFYDGIVEKRTGYIDYGTGTIAGTPIKIYLYTDINETEYEMLCTTSKLYYKEASGDVWTELGEQASSTENRMTFCTMFINSKMYLLHGSTEHAVYKWDGTTYDALTSTSTYKPKIMLPYQFRLLMFNIDEDGTYFPIKFRYSIPTPTDAITDWTGTGSGSRNMIQGAGSHIMNAVAIKDYVGVYKDRSISILDYVGGSSIFATAVHIDGIGLLAQDAIVNLGTSHLFLASDYNIYEWNGGWELIPIGNSVKSYIKANIDKDYGVRSFAIPNFENTEAHFFFPTDEGYPTSYLTYNWTDKTWALNTLTDTMVSGGGNLNLYGGEKALLGLSVSGAGAVEHYDYNSLNDDGVAINSYFTTPDVTIDKEEYKIKMKDFRNVYVDAKGNNLGMYYSTNEGSTWSTVDTDALESTSIYNLHAFNYAAAARNIRFKFANSTASQSYSVRFVGIEHKDIKQSGRK
jgi:hypothetical protein